MNSAEFSTAAKVMAEFITEYRDNIEKYRVLPDVEPGFLLNEIPKEAPQKPEEWEAIMEDMKNMILPGLTHWLHPYFFAYFPSAASYPCVLADMITGALASNGTSWAACPAATELEIITMDWIARAMNLPKQFIFSEPESEGGGVLLTSASESNLLSMLTARNEALKYMKSQSSTTLEDSFYLDKMVAYCSQEAHSSIEKAAMVALVKLRILDVDQSSKLRGETLKRAIDNDVASGLVPFYVAASLGTTSSTAFDNLTEIGPIVKNLPCCWLHCDGAYGGATRLCPEMRYLTEGLHFADSYNCNGYKWLLINFDAACLWIKDRTKLTQALVNNRMEKCIQGEKRSKLEFRHTGIPLGRKFKALKVWFALRTYGLEGLQRNIRNHCTLAKALENMVLADPRFEVVNRVKTGLVCFRLRGLDDWTEKLLDELNLSGLLHLIPSRIQNKYCIRLVANNDITKKNIDRAWEIIQLTTSKIINNLLPNLDDRRKSSLTQEAPLPNTTYKLFENLPQNSSQRRKSSFSQEVVVTNSTNRRPSLRDFAAPIETFVNDAYSDNDSLEEELMM